MQRLFSPGLWNACFAGEFSPELEVLFVIVASQPTRRCAEGTARLEAAKRSGGWYPAARMTWCGEVCRAAGRWSGGHSAHASQLSDEQSITIVSFGRYNTNVHPFADLARIGCAPTTCRRQTHFVRTRLRPTCSSAGVCRSLVDGLSVRVRSSCTHYRALIVCKKIFEPSKNTLL